MRRIFEFVANSAFLVVILVVAAVSWILYPFAKKEPKHNWLLDIPVGTKIHIGTITRNEMEQE